jgi:D-alanyl-D-alanine carboxypeptidase
MKYGAVAIFICFLVNFAVAQDTELARRIDAIAAKALSRPTAGLSIAIARKHKVVFSRGYGLANVDHSVQVTPETVFHIASISKNILAAVLLQLVEKGKLDLDADVTRYVPDAPVQGHQVTVRQLLNHTSGIFSFTSLPNAEVNERLDLDHTQVLALVKDKQFDFDPGTAWRYNNTGFYLAGMVVERVTGQDYGTYVREQLFKPLGMSSAMLCDARMIVPHLTAGYERDKKTLVNTPFISWKLPHAAGAICSTAEDLLKWEAALDSGRVLSTASLKMLRSPTQLKDGTWIDYGLGTRLGSFAKHKVVGHTGSGGGFGNVLVNYPADDLTIVVLMNTGNSAASALGIAGAIARPLLGLPEKTNLLDLAVPKEELAALTGTYNSDESTVETYEKDGKLHFRDPVSHAEGVLLRQAENVYALNADLEIRFVVKNGRAVWAQVYTDGLLMDAVRRVR